jgi:HD-GYP domain-containing protein (c-di-GMP phosphodiesterase class II)
MRLVALRELNPEMVLAKSIFVNGNVYINKGTNGLDRYSDRLDRMGIACVYIEDEVSEAIEIPESITDETRTRCKDALRDAYSSVRENMTVDVEKLEGPLAKLMEEVMENKDVQINLSDINAVDDYTFGHSVSTAVYAALIGIDLGFGEIKMKELCLGAILHDAGKMLIDPAILRKEGKLTEDEFKEIKRHPQLTYDILSRCKSLSEDVRLIGLQHHERLNGKGYPNRLGGYRISAYGRIVAVADVYDALSSDRCYRSRWPNNKILDYLTEESGKSFDNEMVASLLKRIAVYPTGSQVRLSDGSQALVVRQNEQMPLRPVVRVFKNPEGHIIPVQQIDMMERLSITIVASQLEIQREEEQQSAFKNLRKEMWGQIG